MSKNRKSKVDVTVVDVELIMNMLMDQLIKLGRWQDGAKSISPCSMNWCYIKTSNGIYFLDDEACGPGQDELPISNDRTTTWPLYIDDGTFIGRSIPSMGIMLSEETILGFPAKGTMNFAEFVRSFGSRIESNFHQWNDFLESLETIH